MGLFVKVQKSSAYFKRFQVKYRRRRSAKTDYAARRRLIQQAKNKYDTPKYRLVVRLTNRDVIVQVVGAKIVGDFVLTAAYSHELKKKYGVPVGLTNYAACYATGLLAARRLLAKLGLADKYVGVKEVSGKEYNVGVEGDRKPFSCILDTGLARTTSGARVFAALKGAVDGGLSIPHSSARFAGFDGSKLNEEDFRERLLGGHVAAYLKDVVASGAGIEQFQQYVKNKIAPGAVEGLWLAAHKKIREDPSPAPKKAFAGKAKSYANPARTTGTRVAIRNQRRAAFKRQAETAVESGDDSE